MTTIDIPTLITVIVSNLVTLVGGIVAMRSSLLGELRELLDITNAELKRTRAELSECRELCARLQRHVIRLGGRLEMATMATERSEKDD